MSICYREIKREEQCSFPCIGKCILCVCGCSRVIRKHTLQTADEEFDKLSESVTKKASLLVHHINGAIAARKRFGAMLGMAN